MIFQETKLTGAFVIELEPRVDDRGYFARSYCEREFRAHGLPTFFPQCNLSHNARSGTLRGMHYNVPPYEEAKLIRCVRGDVFDVIVDLRPTSPTRFSWIGVSLTADNGRALFVPEGFAHGFITLSDDADVLYHMGKFYEPNAARGLRWNDPAIGIEWPREPAFIAERDASYPDFEASRAEG